MKELKFMQNSYCTEDWDFGKILVPVKVVTTMKRLEVYLKGKLIACSGVVRECDFNYHMLLSFAKHNSGSKIEY